MYWGQYAIEIVLRECTSIRKALDALFNVRKFQFFFKKKEKFPFFLVFLEASQIVLAKLYESSPDTFVL